MPIPGAEIEPCGRCWDIYLVRAQEIEDFFFGKGIREPDRTDVRGVTSEVGEFVRVGCVPAVGISRGALVLGWANMGEGFYGLGFCAERAWLRERGVGG